MFTNGDMTTEEIIKEVDLLTKITSLAKSIDMVDNEVIDYVEKEFKILVLMMMSTRSKRMTAEEKREQEKAMVVMNIRSKISRRTGDEKYVQNVMDMDRYNKKEIDDFAKIFKDDGYEIEIIEGPDPLDNNYYVKISW